MNAETLKPGTKVLAKFNGELKEATYVEVCANNSSYAMVDFGDKVAPRAFSMLKPVTAETAATVITVPEPQVVSAPVFDSSLINVNVKFQHIERMVDMIVRDVERSLVVTGSGGLGKSHTVFNRLKLNDLGPADMVEIKGHCTPKSMYRTLYDNNGQIVVFDDCDSVVSNESAANILKGALDGSGRRTISWRSERDSGLPESFEFTGRVIFISNYTLEQFPQALVSRALYVDVTMTPAEKIERIRTIGPQLCPDATTTELNDCIELIDALRDRVSDLNFRTLTKVVSIRKANPQIWREMAGLMITSRLNRTGR